MNNQNNDNFNDFEINESPFDSFGLNLCFLESNENCFNNNFITKEEIFNNEQQDIAEIEEKI